MRHRACGIRRATRSTALVALPGRFRGRDRSGQRAAAALRRRGMHPTRPKAASKPRPQSLGRKASAAKPRPQSIGGKASAAKPRPQSLGGIAAAAKPRRQSLGGKASAAKPRPQSLGRKASAAKPRPQSLGYKDLGHPARAQGRHGQGGRRQGRLAICPGDHVLPRRQGNGGDDAADRPAGQSAAGGAAQALAGSISRSAQSPFLGAECGPTTTSASNRASSARAFRTRSLWPSSTVS
jgi:hypothetical protein